MSEHAVVIAGGGPTGMMLGAELTLAGVDVVMVEQRPTADLQGSRTGGLQARTLEVFDQRGIAERFLSAGRTAQVNSFAMITLDISDFPSRHPYGLALWQDRIEAIMAEWIAELGVPVRRGVEVTGFTQDDSGVDVALSRGEPLRAQYLVGCDGGRSTVRKAAAIEFAGWDATSSTLVAEVELGEEAEMGMRRDELGIHGISPMEDRDRVRVVVREQAIGPTGDASLEQLSAAMVAVWGRDFALSRADWISRFTDASRQAVSYRERRVLLAGDAAHIHSPAGGQGLSTGVQDAFNLGWKLARVVDGTAPESLLDSYEAERHPVGARVLRMSMAHLALHPLSPRIDALREEVAEMVAMDEPRKMFGGLLSGLAIHYDLGDGHPLLGRRVPDLDLVIEGEAVRLYELMHEGWPLLIDFAEGATSGIAGWSDRVRRVEASYDGVWELPVIGEVQAPRAVLVRPDGHVGWVGDGRAEGLRAALERWFGPPARSQRHPGPASAASGQSSTR